MGAIWGVSEWEESRHTAGVWVGREANCGTGAGCESTPSAPGVNSVDAICAGEDCDPRVHRYTALPFSSAALTTFSAILFGQACPSAASAGPYVIVLLHQCVVY